MPRRVKRSISVAPELDAAVREAARGAGITYSKWLQQAAERTLRHDVTSAGQTTEYGDDPYLGNFTSSELADADAWLDRMIAKAGAPSEQGKIHSPASSK